MRHLSVLAAALLAAAPAAAQEAPELRQILHVSVKGSTGAVVFERPIVESDVVIEPNVGVLLELNCETAALCQDVRVETANGLIAFRTDPGSTPQQKRAEIPKALIPKGPKLQLRLSAAGSSNVMEFETTADKTSPHGFLAHSCDAQLTLQGDFYDAANDAAQFVVSSTGTVLARPNGAVDENDSVLVYLVGRGTELNNIRIRRASQPRQGGSIIIQGAGADTTKLTDETGDCRVVRANLGDFAAGKGEVEIVRLPAQTGASNLEIGKFDFTVNPLYVGAFTMGPVVTFNDDRTYDTLADRTITETSRGSETNYVVGYTHFLFGRRDTEKSGPFGLGLTVAVQPNEVFDHAYLGAALDLYGTLFLIGGVHGADVTRLNADSGLQVGSQLPAGFKSIPTQDEWRWGGFVGLTIDLRAATGLLRQAGTSLIKGK